MKKLTSGQWLKLTAILTAISGAVLAYGDRVAKLPLPNWAVVAWPFVMIAASVIHQCASVLFPQPPVNDTLPRKPQ